MPLRLWRASERMLGCAVSDTQHEAAIEVARRDLLEAVEFVCMRSGSRNLATGVREKLAAYDAARSGDGEHDEGVWATVVINPDSFEPEEITDEKFLYELSETGISLERMFIRPAASSGEAEGDEAIALGDLLGRLNRLPKEQRDLVLGPASALSQHPEPRQDQPVDRASGKREPSWTLLYTDEDGWTVAEVWNAGALTNDGRNAITVIAKHPEWLPAEHPETGERNPGERCDVAGCPHCERPFCPHSLCDGSGVLRDSVDGTNVPLESTCPCRIPSPEPLQDDGDREQRLIEVIVSGLSREAFDVMLVDLSELMHEKWPELGPAVAGRYSLPEHPHQDVEPARHTIRTILSRFTLSDDEWLCIDNLLERFAHQDVERLREGLRTARRRVRQMHEAGFDSRRREIATDAICEIDDALAPHPMIDAQTGAGLAGPPLGPQGAAPAAETGNLAPDAPTQLGSEESAPNSTAGKLGSRFPTPQTQAMRDVVESASPDDRGGER